MNDVRITKSATNVPLIEVHNFCIINSCDYDSKTNEIVLLEAIKEGLEVVR